MDFKHIEATITPDFFQKKIKGKYSVSFEIIADVDSVYLDAKHMKVEAISAHDFVVSDQHIIIKSDFKKGTRHTVAFFFEVQPKKALYFVNSTHGNYLWTQGQGKYTSHWLPSIDDMNDKIEFDISVVTSKKYKALSNGVLKSKKVVGENILWNYDMGEPMSSYLVALVIGDYEVHITKSASGVPIELYYYPSDDKKVAPTYAHTKSIFDFLEQETGVPYPWNIYRQVPVKDFLYAGMENTSLTIFSDDFMVDSQGVLDHQYTNVNAHELAHQWFGNLITEQNSKHHWLHEGFATYYALLAERRLYGEDYFYYKLFESAEQLRVLSDQGKGQALVAAGGTSLTYYQKGAWAIHVLRTLVGEAVFKKAVQTYLKQYAYQNVTTTDFITIVKNNTTVDLEKFEKNWLDQSAFQAEEALGLLKESRFLQQFFTLQAYTNTPFLEKKSVLIAAINSQNEYLQEEAVYQLINVPSKKRYELLQKASNSAFSRVRVAVANCISLKNSSRKEAMLLLKLLKDKSYSVQELVLYKSWVLADTVLAITKHEVLDAFKSSFGFVDGNVKTLWLALALATNTYNIADRKTYFETLTNYTDVHYPMGLRKNAFKNLYQIGLFSPQSQVNLIKDCFHHNWRHRSFARKLLMQLTQENKADAYWQQATTLLLKKEKEYLQTLRTKH